MHGFTYEDEEFICDISDEPTIINDKNIINKVVIMRSIIVGAVIVAAIIFFAVKRIRKKKFPTF